MRIVNGIVKAVVVVVMTLFITGLIAATIIDERQQRCPDPLSWEI